MIPWIIEKTVNWEKYSVIKWKEYIKFYHNDRFVSSFLEEIIDFIELDTKEYKEYDYWTKKIYELNWNTFLLKYSSLEVRDYEYYEFNINDISNWNYSEILRDWNFFPKVWPYFNIWKNYFIILYTKNRLTEVMDKWVFKGLIIDPVKIIKK
jgi:hypothetical protein